MKPSLAVNICGVKLKNPLIAASGTFGFGREYNDYFDISLLGGISVKGLTLKPRQGNPAPRVAETPAGMLNAVGLQNPGVEAFIQEELPWLLSRDIAVIANMAGSTVEEYVQMAERLSNSGVHLLEMNISCPNVHEGGMAFGARPNSVYEVTNAAKAVAKKPLIVKLSPNVTDICEVALAAQEAGADGLSLINTLQGMAVDVRTRKPILGNVMGGLSGPAVKPVALRMVYQVSRTVSIPVIGMGGIMTGEDAAAFMLCGAKAVMVGTAGFYDPQAMPRIIEELSTYLITQNETDVNHIVGKLRGI